MTSRFGLGEDTDPDLVVVGDVSGESSPDADDFVVGVGSNTEYLHLREHREGR